MRLPALRPTAQATKFCLVINMVSIGYPMPSPLPFMGEVIFGKAADSTAQKKEDEKNSLAAASNLDFIRFFLKSATH